LRKPLAKCDYSNKLLKIGNRIVKLYPYKIIRINPRTPIIEATTTMNNTRIIQTEEAQPEVRKLSDTAKSSLINIINTTETHEEMQVPCITPIEIASEDICESSIQKEKEEEIKTLISRTICIENIFELKHLNAEKKKSMTEICTVRAITYSI